MLHSNLPIMLQRISSQNTKTFTIFYFFHVFCIQAFFLLPYNTCIILLCVWNVTIVNALLHSQEKPGLKKTATELKEVLFQSVKIINYIKKTML
jgi:hypothetical protein